MAINKEKYLEIINQLKPRNVTLVAVSKIKPEEDILALYNLGQRDFGENYVQELVDKAQKLPKDIQWHFIGHLQSNKIKYIAPFVYLVHSVDSYKLLKEINKQGAKNKRIINVLLQVHIAQEHTKFGLNEKELGEIFESNPSELAALKNINIIGLMGMASFTDDKDLIKKEFSYLKTLFDKFSKIQATNVNLQTLSIGMSDDYKIALEHGSTMVRIGSLLFGRRI